ncbi:Exocyst complex component [Arachis hypogaea]|nr:Exocyst complex component [Arachis hypogaea]
MHDDGYSWRKYEENPLRRGNQTSCYRCAHPNCKVKKKVERTIDGEIIHVNYKGTHAHYRKPRFTIKRNSSSESFYSYLSSKPFHTDMIDQSLLAFNGNGQLDHNSTRELIIINMTCEMLNFSMLRIKMCQKADEDHSSGQLVENPLESVIAVIVSVLGLLCYALSSSFNSLFGKWNMLKTFLYCVFSFIICTAVLFIKVSHGPGSLRLKAHLAFLVLMITSFYSFYFDKAVNGKPDAYSIASCAAFAVMFLGLSRHSNCGFELDLLYFFLAALTIQLTRIKWVFGILGACYSYALIMIHSGLDAQQGANGYHGVPEEPHVIQVDPPESLLNSSITQDSAITQVDSHSQEVNNDFALIKPGLLSSLKALKKQNRKLLGLLYGQSLMEPFDLDDNLLIDMLPCEIINNINETFKMALAAGYEKECCHLYSNCRREFLQQFLSELELKHTPEDHNVFITHNILSWNRTFKIALRVLFLYERRLCDRVFFGFSSVGDLSFVLACKELTTHLLNFVNTIVVDIRSPLAMFRRVVSMFEELNDMITELESLFPDQAGVSLRNDAIKARRRLGETIRDVFKNLENLIHCDSAIADVPGGIEPITCDVMNCLGAIVRVMPMIEKAFKEYPTTTCPSFPAKIAWMIELLENHLEAKYKIYTGTSLDYVTMMNNTMYIKLETLKHFPSARFMDFGRVKRYSFAEILGDNWIQKHTGEFQKNLEDYQRSSWDEVLGLLKLDNNNESLAKDVAIESMKEKLKLFNIQFEEICCTQSKWFVSYEIRKEIIVSVENMLLPAYGSFVGRLQDVLGKASYDYIQYGMLEIKARLNRLFLGGKRMSR